jgi:hypothetical protein
MPANEGQGAQITLKSGNKMINAHLGGAMLVFSSRIIFYSLSLSDFVLFVFVVIFHRELKDWVHLVFDPRVSYKGRTACIVIGAMDI